MRSAAAGVGLALLLAAAAGDSAAQAAPDGGRWLLRARSLHLDPGIDDGIGLFITIEPLRFVEIDLSWFVRPEWAIELAITVPQSHSVKSAGFEVGQLRQLPPTLMLQYHLTGWRVQPYLAAGISYTLVSNFSFAPAFQEVLQPTLRNRSVAPAWGIGVEMPLAGGWSFNADWKQLELKTDIESLGPDVGYFRVKPRLASIGFGWRF